jgi:hypothetical protein
MGWGSDSQYALGIMVGAMAASTELQLVAIAREEARFAFACWKLCGSHTPSHAGFPPNECADVIAFLGRKKLFLSERVETVLASVSPLAKPVHEPVPFSIHHALYWTDLEEGRDPVEGSVKTPSNLSIYEIKVATATVLTLAPADEGGADDGTVFHSHRRIDLAAQFQQEGYTIIGLQETRLKKSRSMPVGIFTVIASPAGDKGHAGIDLWIKSSFLSPGKAPIVLHADMRMLFGKK